MKKEDIDFRKKCKEKGYNYANIISHFALKSQTDYRREKKRGSQIAVSPVVVFGRNKNI